MASSSFEVFSEIAKARRSIRRFKPDPVPEGMVEKIVEVARFAMSGANAQPWEFVVVKKPELRNGIFELYRLHRKQVDVFNNTLLPELRHPVTGSLDAGQRIFQDAPVIIVVCGDPRTLLATSLAAEVIGYERVTYHFNLANVTTMIHLAAASLGLGTQWVSTTPIWEGRLKGLLGVPEWFTVPHLIPLGYADYTPPKPYRREVAEMVHYDGYDPQKVRSDTQILEYIAQVRKHARAGYYVPRRKKS